MQERTIYAEEVPVGENTFRMQKSVDIVDVEIIAPSVPKQAQIRTFLKGMNPNESRDLGAI